MGVAWSNLTLFEKYHSAGHVRNGLEGGVNRKSLAEVQPGEKIRCHCGGERDDGRCAVQSIRRRLKGHSGGWLKMGSGGPLGSGLTGREGGWRRSSSKRATSGRTGRQAQSRGLRLRADFREGSRRSWARLATAMLVDKVARGRGWEGRQQGEKRRGGAQAERGD